MKTLHPALLLLLGIASLALPGRAQQPAKSNKSICDCGRICANAKVRCKINPCDGKKTHRPQKKNKNNDKKNDGSTKKPAVSEAPNQSPASTVEK